MNDDELTTLDIQLFEHEAGVVKLVAISPDDLNTRDWKIGDTFSLKVIGIERRSWEEKRL